VPATGAVQSTLQFLADIVECVTFPETSFAFRPGLEKVPAVELIENPPISLETTLEDTVIDNE